MTPPRELSITQLSDRPKTEARLNKHITTAGPDDCWLWTGRVNADGYGRIDVTLTSGGHNITVMAHRLAYLLAGHEIPSGLILRHSCDVTRCCNPGHLRPGTQTENMADRTSRQRLPVRCGESNSNARITQQIADAIRSAHGRNIDIAAEYGVSPSLVGLIKNGRRWAGPGAADRKNCRPARHNKLTQQQVDAIRENRQGLTGSELARRNNVSPGTVSLIRKGKSW